MDINNFELYRDYSIFDLMDTFKNKSFYYGKGMNYIRSSNSLVLISKYTKDRMYQDEIKNGLIYYTGMGQEGDQQVAFQNKTLVMAKQNNTTVYMFIVYEDGKYTYYGRVELNEPYYYADELDKHNAMRKVLKFPLSFIDAFAPIPSKKLSQVISGGTIPTINVVGACILKNNNLLCALRADHKKEGGKWEFAGGKVENGETNEAALIREIKEELNLNIQVGEVLDTSNRYDRNDNCLINLTVYYASIVDGELKNKEHKEVSWKSLTEIESLDWAASDIPIVQTLLESQPGDIVGLIDYVYKPPIKKAAKNSEVKRSCQDYEKSQKKKAKSGDAAELAVMRYEANRLTNLDRVDLASMIDQVSKKSSDYGYDIKSFDVVNGMVKELHIEVKSGVLSGNKIEFFISQAELNKCTVDDDYKIYVLLKNGLVNYKLHIVKRDEFLANNYCSPITYKVSIPVEQF